MSFVLVPLFFSSCLFVCLSADVNECEQFQGICEFQCVNTIGSYECRCPAGGILNADQRTCSGRYIYANSVFFVSCSYLVHSLADDIKLLFSDESTNIS